MSILTGQSGRTVTFFKFAGISVHIHWSWFVVALIELQQRKDIYGSQFWNVLEYLALFLIVLLHEFGHAFACRQVGGKAEQIVLWPLGGVAYVSPPQRPGAMLWSIAAGPLVNVLLIPIIIGIGYACKAAGIWELHQNAHTFLLNVAFMNAGILIFNLLPVYPLDGGQILRALLWYPLGRGRSLTVTTIIGFVGVAGLLALAFYTESKWLGIMAIFMALSCRRGWRVATALATLAKMPRRDGFHCPSCNARPPLGEHWVCSGCKKNFDTFANNASCPECKTVFPTTRCIDCGVSNPMAAWTSLVQATHIEEQKVTV